MDALTHLEGLRQQSSSALAITRNWYGDMRVYPDFDDMVTVGWWGRFDETGHEVIGINQGSYNHGWQGQRLHTGIHEGWHKSRAGGGETEAGHFADYCVNW